MTDLHTAPERPIPITIITGFLGAGKTTLLNHILHGDHGLRVAVLVNDFGSINIDAQLIVGVEGETVNLANGCICCTIREDLLKETIRLVQRADPPEYLIVETSGVSDPLQVAQTFMLPAVSDMIAVDSIVTVVDADQLPSLTGNNAMLAMEQMAVADMIVLNKTDMVSPEGLKALKKDWLYPQARVFETSFGKVPLALLLGVGRYDPSQLLGRTPKDIHVHEAGEPLDHDHHHDHDGDHADHDHEEHDSHHEHHEHTDHSLVFNTWSWYSEEPISFKAFRKAVKTLPPTIYRAKGFVYLADSADRRAELHVVGSRVRLVMGDEWGGRKPYTQLVLIGSAGGVNEEELRARFEQTLAENESKNLLNRAFSSIAEWVRGGDPNS
jgi:G3E family GTPase